MEQNNFFTESLLNQAGSIDRINGEFLPISIHNCKSQVDLSYTIQLPGCLLYYSPLPLPKVLSHLYAGIYCKTKMMTNLLSSLIPNKKSTF
jgi:hypothetical protein